MTHPVQKELDSVQCSLATLILRLERRTKAMLAANDETAFVLLRYIDALNRLDARIEDFKGNEAFFRCVEPQDAAEAEVNLKLGWPHGLSDLLDGVGNVSHCSTDKAGD
jgi:hypothetical protein